MKRKLKVIAVLPCCLALLLFFAGCEEQGPAEKAGEQIDEAVQETQENIEEAVEEGGEKLEEAGEKMQ
jgi:outer membrane lipoprotein-sorting protein